MCKLIFDDQTFIILDTSVILDLYDYSLVSCIRLMHYLKKYVSNIKLTNYIKKEVELKMIEKERNSINKYSDLKNKIDSTKDEFKSLFKNKLKVFEKNQFRNIEELKAKVNSFCDNIDPIFAQYFRSIQRERDQYENYVRDEVSPFIKELIDERVEGIRYSNVDYIEIIKEGRIRYDYKMPPGYKDNSSKVSLGMYGDLIIWKQIINIICEYSNKKFIFVTSDVKEDWFDLRSEVPRKELLLEFEHFNNNNNSLSIISLKQFIDKVTIPLNPDDTALINEVEKKHILDNLNLSIYTYVLRDYIEINSDFLNNLHKYCPGQKIEILHTNISDLKVNDLCIEIKERKTYTIEISADAYVYFTAENEDILQSAKASLKINSNILFEQNIEESTQQVINIMSNIGTKIFDYNKFKYKIIDVNFDTEYDKKDVYSICSICGKGIGSFNDAGNGYCRKCTRENDL